MVSFRTGVAAALAACMLGSTLAVPLADKLRSLSPGARDLLKRSNPAAPRFVIYDDAGLSLPSADQLKGYNVYVLGFWQTNGVVDMAQTWQDLSDSERGNYLQEYNSAGISLMVSAFGGLDAPTTRGFNAVDIANQLSSWVLRYGVHGLDVDYEDFDAFNKGSAESWIISLTQQLRTKLPQGEYILTHAPVAPWFSPNIWNGGGYLHVHWTVGYMIDWYNIQFYNQGTHEYKFCSGLLWKSFSNYPESSVFQIHQNGVDLNKLVIGKPATPGDADNGYMDTWKLAWCVSQARDAGWSAGVSAYEFVHAGSSWIAAVRGNTF